MSPFSGLVSLWLNKIEMAWEQKNKRYGKDARDGMFFYCGPYDRMYDGTMGGAMGGSSARSPSTTISMIPPPAMRLTLNKVSELVQLFGPFLYYKNPNRQVTARKQVATTTDLLGAAINSNPQYAPLMQQLFMMSQQQNAADTTMSVLVEALLNATPYPLDLKSQSRMAIDEALIAGLGLLWTTKFQPPGSPTPVIGSYYGTQADLLIDPDATTWQNALWIARRTICPVWEAEKRWQLPPGSLKPNVESNNRQGEIRGMGFDGVMFRTQGRTCDMVIYYEVWSKTGLGSRLKGANDRYTQQATEGLVGDYAYIVVSPGQQFPLNAGPQLMAMPNSPENMQVLQQAFSWETPFYVDGGWPCCPLVFHEIPNDPWPASHISFALGELKLMNWIGSWVTGKIRTTCRDFIACPKRLADELKQTIQSGSDLSLLEITEEYKDVREILQFIQQGPMNTDIWQVLEIIERWFDQRTGLTELMYGQSSRQYRSAAEAEIKKDQANIRPEDMANRVEDWQSLVARREAFASRWHLQGDDVMPFLGKPGAALWQMLVVNQDPSTMLYDLQYRVEAGSIRKPNRSRDAENATALMQTVMPLAVQYFQLSGNIDPINQILSLWKKSMDIDQSVVNFPPLMMPPMPPGGPQGGGPPQPGGPQQQGPPAAGPQPAIAA
jgi:hypothetical protein